MGREKEGRGEEGGGRKEGSGGEGNGGERSSGGRRGRDGESRKKWIERSERGDMGHLHNLQKSNIIMECPSI